MNAARTKLRSSTKKRIFAQRLLSWFSANKGSFPWRETRNPYKILIAEMLLRKTTRKQVMKIFPEFIEKYPDVSSLKVASTNEIERVITTLGMEHQRAYLLKALAERLMADFDGRIPLRHEALLSLPGVGPYAANAVMCFCLDMKKPLVDTNVIRVVQRVFSFDSSKKRPRTDPKMWEFVSRLIPNEKASAFNLSLLDFAAVVCTPKNPKCSDCPLTGICDHHAEHKA